MYGQRLIMLLMDVHRWLLIKNFDLLEWYGAPINSCQQRLTHSRLCGCMRWSIQWVFAVFCFFIVLGPVVMTRTPKRSAKSLVRDVWASFEVTLLIIHLVLSIILAAQYTYHDGDLYSIIITWSVLYEPP
jgi:hypothetical protein